MVINWTFSIVFCIFFGVAIRKKPFSPRIPSCCVTPQSAFKQRQMTGTRSSHVMGTVIASTLVFSTWRPWYVLILDWFGESLWDSRTSWEPQLMSLPLTTPIPMVAPWYGNPKGGGGPVAYFSPCSPTWTWKISHAIYTVSMVLWSSARLALPFGYSWSFIMSDITLIQRLQSEQTHGLIATFAAVCFLKHPKTSRNIPKLNVCSRCFTYGFSMETFFSPPHEEWQRGAYCPSFRHLEGQQCGCRSSLAMP